MPARAPSSAALLALLWLAGCGAGTTTETGQATLALTDSASDELAVLEVDLAGVRLHKLGGGTVSVLARTTRLDFTSLDEVSEIVQGFTLPVGIYTGMTLTFDFDTAVAWIKDKTTPASIVDDDGQPLTGQQDVPISFATAARPEIGVTRSHLFQVDLDLDQAIQVDAANNRVTLVPAISAELDKAAPKPLAATGYLAALDAAAASFTVEKRDLAGHPLGTFRVQTGSTTVFQIDGQVFLGAAGLTELAKLPVGTTRVFAQGTLHGTRRLLLAAAVEAGAGTFGNGQDWVEGLVTARAGGSGVDPVLTVYGRSRQESTGARTFNTSHTVNLARGTSRVLRRGLADALGTEAINVGQRVLCFGTLAGTTLDATAATGVVRMLRTGVWGTANAAPVGNELRLSLVRIGLRPIASFDFTVNSQQEANPASFEVDVTGLSATGITAGTKVRALGWFNPVGIPTDDHFDAVSLANHSAEGRLLLGAWSPPRQNALAPVSAAGIYLDASTAVIKSVFDGFGSTPLATSPQPSVLPLLAAGVYRIIEGASLEQHHGFDSYAASLALRLTGKSVSAVSGLGTFDETTQTFRALVLTVHVK